MVSVVNNLSKSGSQNSVKEEIERDRKRERKEEEKEGRKAVDFIQGHKLKAAKKE